MANKFKIRKGLIVQGSGSTGDETILDIQGSSGQLFSIIDNPSLPTINIEGSISSSDVQINDWGSVSASLAAATLTNPITGTGTTNYLSKFTGASTLGNSLVYDNGTNVGIGTISPASKLHIRSSNSGATGVAGGTLIVEQGSAPSIQILSANTQTQSIKFGDPQDGDVGRINYSHTDNHMALFTDGSEKMRIDSSGNVGIGTSSPLSPLHVKAAVDSGKIAEFRDVNNAPRIEIIDENGGLPPGIKAPTTGTGLGIYGDAGPIRILQNGTDAIYINTSRNVGIGTTSPSQKLHLNNGIARFSNISSNWIDIDGSDAASNNAIISARLNQMQLKTNAGFGAPHINLLPGTGGNVGIGTTAPSEKLEVVGKAIVRRTGTATAHSDTDLLVTDATAAGSTAQIEILGGNNASSTLKFADTDSYTAGAIDYSHVADSMSFRTNGSVKAVIDTTGNVGIGTTTPTERLHVVGDAKIEDDLHVEGDLHLEGDIGFRVINSGGFGQPEIELPNFADVFYRADRRFTVTTTGGTTNVSGLFGGNFSSLTSFAANTTHTITINVSNQSGVPINGFTYPQGYIYISFYSTTNNYDSISGRFKDRDNNYHSMSGLTDIIPNDGNYKVMRLTVPSNNYAVEYEITLVTGTDLVRLAAINYLSSRHTSQMELPYLNKTLDTNRLFGNVDVLTNSSVAQNRLSGTSNSYLNANTGNVGIGTTSPSEKLHVSGSGVLIQSPSYSDAGFTISDDIYDYRIGTTPPQVKTNYIHIQRNGSNTRFAHSGGAFIWTTGGTEVARISSEGNVGIGTTAPSEKLDVDGNIKISGDLDFSSRTVPTQTSSISSPDGNKLTLESSYWINAIAGNAINFKTPSLYITGTTSESNGLVFKKTTTPVANNTTFHIGQDFNSSIGISGRAKSVTQFFINRTIDASTGNLIDFQEFGSSRFLINSSGNVGIGTTSPSEKLHVEGTSIIKAGTEGIDNPVLTVQNTIPYQSPFNQYLQVWKDGAGSRAADLRADGSFTITGGSTAKSFVATQSGALSSIPFRASNSGNTGMYFPSVNVIGFANSGSESMRITSGGNVGIGTTSPGNKLSISGPSSNQFEIINSINSKSWRPNINGNDFYITETGVSNPFVIQAGGNVGIGTTAPAAKLDVEGDIRLGVGHKFQIWNDNVGMYRDSNDLRLAGYTGIQFFSSATSMTAQTERMRIDGTTGNVGIGTTSPLSKLQIVGTSSSGLLRLTDTSGTARIASSNAAGSVWENLELRASNILLTPQGGNVGIGTTSPSEKLDVIGNGIFHGNVTLLGDVSGYVSLDSPSGSMVSFNSNTFDFSFAGGGIISNPVMGTNTFYTYGSEKMRIDSAGNLGIGTTSPGYKLDVAGDMNLGVNTGFNDSNRINFQEGFSYIDSYASFGSGYISMNIGSGEIYLRSDGNVGIDTSNPSEKLHVIGNILASGDITAFSDSRIKENIETLPNALESVKQMRGVTYNKIGEEKQSIGVIAQEVQSVLPELVSEHNDGMLSVAYGNITAVLIEAIKEQQNQIEELEEKINNISKLIKK